MRVDSLNLSILGFQLSLVRAESESHRSPALRLYLTVSGNGKINQTNSIAYYNNPLFGYNLTVFGHYLIGNMAQFCALIKM